MSIEKLSWKEINPLLVGIKSKLLEVLDKINSSEKVDLEVIKIKYPYGKIIVKDGKFLLPKTHGSDVDGNLNQVKLNKVLEEECLINPIPLSLVLKGSVEVYQEYQYIGRASVKEIQLTCPYTIFYPGDFFGIFETIDTYKQKKYSSKPWSVSSGARTIDLLVPHESNNFARKVVEKIGRSRADALKLKGVKENEWQICGYLNEVLDLGWETEIVIFPSVWFKKNKYFHELKAEIFSIGWDQSENLREDTFMDLYKELTKIINNVSFDDPKNTLRITLLTLKHLIETAEGKIPGFGVDRHAKDSVGPFSKISDFLSDLCNSYYPFILEPKYLRDSDKMGYFPLNPPLLLNHDHEHHSQSKTVKTQAHNLCTLIDKISHKNNVESVLKKLDKDKTLFYTRDDKFNSHPNIRDIEGFDMRELILENSKIKKIKIPLKHRFFQSFVKVVRL